MAGFRRYAATVAIFATVMFVALVVAVFGMISWLGGVDVVANPRAGVFVGPIAAAAATLLVLGCLLADALRVPQERQRISPLLALGVAVGAYLAFALLGAIAYLIGGGDAVGSLLFFGGLLIGPFAPAVGAIAFVITMLFLLVLASRVAERGRPEWPWEKDDDE